MWLHLSTVLLLLREWIWPTRTTRSTSIGSASVDEFTIHYSPVFFGQGVQLFSRITKNTSVKIKGAVASKEVTHVTFEVEKSAMP